MRSLVFFSLFLFLEKEQVSAQNFLPPCADADIVFLADWSGSVEGYESSLEEGLSTLLSLLPPKENIFRYGVVSFASSAHVDSYLTSDTTKLSYVLDNWDSKIATGGTNLFDGLVVSRYLFEQNPRETQKILVIVTDGDVDNDTEKMSIELAKNIRDSGIIILKMSEIISPI